MPINHCKEYNSGTGSDSKPIMMTGQHLNEDCPECEGRGYIHCKECGEHVKCVKCGGSGKRYTYNGFGYTVHWDDNRVTASPRIWYTFW